MFLSDFIDILGFYHEVSKFSGVSSVSYFVVVIT